MRAVQGQRVLFMPHAQPGVYIALILRTVQEIEADLESGPLRSKDMNAMTANSVDSQGSVKRVAVKNNLFLDINSLSKNLQTILT